MIPSRFLLVLALLAARQRPSLPPMPPPADGLLASAPVAVSDQILGPTFGRDNWPRIAAGPSQALVVFGWFKAARISAAGEVLDVPPIMLPGSEGPLDVAWDGTRYVVASQFVRNSELMTRLYAVTPSRAVTTIVDFPPDAPATGFAVAANAGEIAVARAFEFSRVDVLIAGSDGALRRRIGLGTSGGGSFLRVVAGGDGTWLVLRPYGGAIITPDRVVPLALRASDAVWTGGSWTVVTEGSGLGFTELFPDGRVGRSTMVRQSPNGASMASIAWNGSEYRVIWKEQTNRDTGFVSYRYLDTVLARIGVEGALIEEVTLARNTDITGRFAIGVDRTAITAVGESFLAAWTRNLATTIETRDLFVSTGERTELVTRKLQPQTIGALAVRPGAARVIWSEWREEFAQPPLRTSEVRADGARGAEQRLPSGGYAAFAGWNGIDTIAVWLENREPFRLVGLRVGRDEQPFVVSALRGAMPLAMDCGAGECAVVWKESNITYVTRLDASGVVLDERTIQGNVVGIAARGDDYLLTWYDQGWVYAAVLRDGRLSKPRLIHTASTSVVATGESGWLIAVLGGKTVHTVRIDAAGEVAGWEDFDLAVASGQPPRLAWSGRHWFLAWTADGDVRGARLDAAGRLVDQFAIAATPDVESLADLGSPGDGTVAVAYTRNARGYVKWLTDLR